MLTLYWLDPGSFNGALFWQLADHGKCKVDDTTYARATHVAMRQKEYYFALRLCETIFYNEKIKVRGVNAQPNVEAKSYLSYFDPEVQSEQSEISVPNNRLDQLDLSQD